MVKQEIRVGIRGFTGKFGWRTLGHLLKCNDMKVTVGVEANSPRFKAFLKGANSLADEQKSKLACAIPSTIVLETGKHDSVRKAVEQLRLLNRNLDIVPFCDFNPLKHCDVFLDLTRGAEQNFEQRFPDFVAKRPLLVTIDTGRHETVRGRLVVPPSFVEPETDSSHENSKNIWRLGDCVTSAVNLLLSGVKEKLGNRLSDIRTTIFCLLDEKLPDIGLLPERVHSLYFKPADFVSETVKSDLRKIFGRDSIGSFKLVQMHGFDCYALSVDFQVLGEIISAASIAEAISGRPHILNAKGMDSTADVDLFLRPLHSHISNDLPPVIFFPDAISVEKNNTGCIVSMGAAVRYLEISPRLVADGIRMVASEYMKNA